MSEPVRYSEVSNEWNGEAAGLAPTCGGEWVKHSDYAALVQKGIRDHGDWRSKLNFLEADYKAEIARLTAENERLKTEQKNSSLSPCVIESDSVKQGEAVFVNIYQHQIDADEIQRLKEENERLRSSVRHYVEQEALRSAGEAIHQQRIESGAYNREKNETIKRLSSENERMRDAGEGMWLILFSIKKGIPLHLDVAIDEAIADWNKAKEGGSK